jgi:hypothetical protein
VPEDVVEDFDLLVGEPISTGDEQIGHASERVDALLFRSAFDRFFELDNKRLPHAHGGASPCARRGCGPPTRVLCYPQRLNKMLNYNSWINKLAWFRRIFRNAEKTGLQARPLT